MGDFFLLHANSNSLFAYVIKDKVQRGAKFYIQALIQIASLVATGNYG